MQWLDSLVSKQEGPTPSNHPAKTEVTVVNREKILHMTLNTELS